MNIAIKAFIIMLIVIVSLFGLYVIAKSFIVSTKQQPITPTTTTTCPTCQVCLNATQIQAVDIKADHMKLQYDLLTIKTEALNRSVDKYRKVILSMRNLSYQGMVIANLTINQLTNVSWNKSDYKKFKVINSTTKSMMDKFRYIYTR